MGVNVYNLSAFCDYATPDNYSAIELHMELPIPHDDLKKVQGWLSRDEWDAAEIYLVGKYPQHRALLHEWVTGSKSRHENKFSVARLVAVS